MSRSLIRGQIERQILFHFRIDPHHACGLLPEQLQPLELGGAALGGFCLSRLTNMRPAFLPPELGVTSEKLTYQLLVTSSQEDGQPAIRPFVLRREITSRLHQLMGSRPDEAPRRWTPIDVEDDGHELQVSLPDPNPLYKLHFVASRATDFPSDSVFNRIQDAAAYFEYGSVGLSNLLEPNEEARFRTENTGWQVVPLQVRQLHVGLFSNHQWFPPGSVQFDSALLARSLVSSYDTELTPFGWRLAPPLAVSTPSF